MTESPLHQALREVRRQQSRPAFWAAIAVVSLLLGLSGPFGTYDALPFVGRLGYWGLNVLVTLHTGWLISVWVVIAFETRGWSVWSEALCAGIAVGVVLTLEVMTLNWLTFGLSPLDPTYAPGIVANTLVTSVVVTAVITWVRRNPAPAAAAPIAAAGSVPPRLLTRLPLDKRGALVSLSVQDHYVEVVTATGRELLLMRLSDAIAETEGCAGLQVHRSHWVALDRVQAARRDGARAVLTLTDGREIPVSRTYLSAAKTAGLLA